MEDQTPTPHDEPPDNAPAGSLAAAGDSWQVPLPPRRTRRRLIQLLAVTLALLAILAVRQLYVRWRSENNGLVEQIAAARKAAEEKFERREERWLESAPADLLTDLAVYLTFEPNTIQRLPRTTIVEDLSGQGYHAVLHGAEVTEQGRTGAGVVLDGEDSYVKIPTVEQAWFQSGDQVTVSMWVYETRYHRLCYPFHSGNPERGISSGMTLLRNASERTYKFSVPEEQVSVSSQECGALEWHHVVGVWTGHEAEIYVDGKRTSSKPRPPRLVFPPDDLPCGVRVGQGFEGTIDEVLIFRRRLFPEEVASLYQMGIEGKRPAPPEPSPSLAPFLAAVDARRAAEADEFDQMLQERLKAIAEAEAKAERGDEGSAHKRTEHETIRAYEITSDGKTLVSGYLCGCLQQQRISMARGTVRAGRGQPEGYHLEGLAVAPVGPCVACYGETGLVCLWDTAQGEPVAYMRTTLKAVHAAAYTLDGKSLLVGGEPAEGDSESSPLGLWNPDTGEKIRGFPMPGPAVLALALSPDGTRVAAWALGDRQFYVFDVASGELICSFPGGPAEVSCMDFLPDGKRFLTGDRDGALRLWDAETGKLLHEFRGHLARVNCVDVSDDGEFALSGSDDGSARVWDLRRGRVVDVYTLATRDDPASVGSVQYVVFLTGCRDFWAGFSCGEVHPFSLPDVLDGPESVPANPAKP